MYANVCYCKYMEEYLTTKEIAYILKVNIITIRRYIHAGKLPALFFGKEFRVKREDFDKFLANKKVKI